MAQWLELEEPLRTREAPQWKAFLELGFRPLYLLGCLWAALSVALWVYAPQWIAGRMPGVFWHAHEMLWAFVATIAVGFLFTAGSNWTGRNPLQGRALGALCLLWLVARAGFLLPGPQAFAVAALCETAFFCWAAVPFRWRAAGATTGCPCCWRAWAWPMRCTCGPSGKATTARSCSASTLACCAWP